MLYTLLTVSTLVLLTACSHDLGLMKQDEALTGYETAVRFGLWEKAAQYQQPARRSERDIARLRGYHVTGYEVRYQDRASSGNLLLQTVEIRYLRPDELSERSMIDRQVWRFDADRDRWWLETDLPNLE
ncbi:MAG TPA: hypothetical protein VNL74_11150 [Methylococcus sp.]|nr:hypothetical protein [Methylococcus sp.]